jgi:hypothetical protein
VAVISHRVCFKLISNTLLKVSKAGLGFFYWRAFIFPFFKMRAFTFAMVSISAVFLLIATGFMITYFVEKNIDGALVLGNCKILESYVTQEKCYYDCHCDRHDHCDRCSRPCYDGFVTVDVNATVIRDFGIRVETGVYSYTSAYNYLSYNYPVGSQKPCLWSITGTYPKEKYRVQFDHPPLTLYLSISIAFFVSMSIAVTILVIARIRHRRHYSYDVIQ